MKKLILSFAALLSTATALRAQQNYYANQNTVVGTNVVYKVEDIGSIYQISNVLNTRDTTGMTLLDGTPAPKLYGHIDIIRIGDHNVIRKVILQEVFTAPEIAALKNSNVVFTLHCIIEPNGHISEILFRFPKKPAAYSIHPDKWYELEQKVKQQIAYTMSPKAQTCTFVENMLLWPFKYIFQ